MINIMITGLETGETASLVGVLKRTPYVGQIFTKCELNELEKMMEEHRIDLIVLGSPEKYLKCMMRIRAMDKRVRFILKTSRKWIQQHQDLLPLVSGFIFDEMSSLWCCKFIQKQISQLVFSRGWDATQSAIQSLEDMIKIESSDGVMLLKTQEILYVEKDDKQIIYHTVNREFYSTATLDESEQRLPDYFYRSHRSYLINMNKISSIVSTGGKGFTVYFKGAQKTALLSYRRRQELMQLWK